MAYRSREIASAPQQGHEDDTSVITVCPHKYACRTKVAAAYDKYLRSGGWQPGGRVRRNAGIQFVKSRLMWNESIPRQSRSVQRRHREFLAANSRLAVANQLGRRTHKGACAGELRHARKDGRPYTANWVREQLFDWFVSMRYSIDWRKYNADLRSGGQHKAMGRFPIALLKHKAMQFLQ